MLRSLKFLGRRVRPGVALLSSQANPVQNDPLADLVRELQNDRAPLRPTPMSEASSKDFLTSPNLAQWVSDHPKVDHNQFLFLLRNTNFLVKSGDLESKESEKLVSSVAFDESKVSDTECVEALTLLLDLGLQKTKLFKGLFVKFQAKGNGLVVSAPALVAFAVAATRNGGFEKDFVGQLEAVLQQQISSLKVTEVLSIFSNFPWNSPSFETSVLAHTTALLPVMTSTEVVALMRHLSQRRLRNQQLLAKIAQSIVEAKSQLSVSQIVTLANACATLKFYDTRVLRKVSKDLAVEINHLNSWNDATSLIESFRKLRLGDAEVWRCLSNWCNAHLSEIETKSIRSIAIVVSAFANMGIENTQPIANVLLRKLQGPKARDSVPTQDIWLQSIYSLALCDSLTPTLAETVLNKEFVEAVLNSRKDWESVANPRRLLQLQAVVVNKFGDDYKGPRISKDTFGKLLTSASGVKSALESKYGRSAKDCTEALLDHGLYKVAPRTHIGAAAIDDMGFFHDAVVSVDENSKFVPVAAWNTQTKVQPVTVIGWKQLKKTFNDSMGGPSIENLLGEEKLMLRLLSAAGQKPVLVFMSDLQSHSSQEAKNKFLKSLFEAK